MATTALVDSAVDGLKILGGTSLSWTHSSTPGLTNPYALVNITSGKSAPAIHPSTVTYDFGTTNQALASKTSQVDANNNCFSEIWGVVPGVLGSKTIKVDFGATSLEITAGSIILYQVNTTTPLVVQTAATGTVGNPSLTGTITAADILVVCGVLNNPTAATTMADNAGQTPIHNDNVGTGHHAGASAYKTGSGSVTIGWSGLGASPDTWTAVGVKVQYDGTSGGGGGGGFFARYYYERMVNNV
jgi:hypothetical protein